MCPIVSLALVSLSGKSPVCPSELGFDTGEQFTEGEGFHDIVICSHLEAEDPVNHIITGRYEYHRHLMSALSDQSAQLVPVHARQPDIEKHQREP